MPKTLFDRIWEAHEVAPNLIYVDLHLVHEVTSPQAFDGLRLAGRKVRRPDRTLATADHNVPTDGTPVAARIKDELSRVQVETLEGGGRGGMVAPDETTFAWVAERGVTVDDAWRELRTDGEATFDKEVVVEASAVSPMVSWGTNPAQVVGVAEAVPQPSTDGEERALGY